MVLAVHVYDGLYCSMYFVYRVLPVFALQVQSTLGENMAAIKNNCESLESRIKSLPQK